MSSGLAKLNALPVEHATTEFLKACGSKRWVAAMVAQRPFASNEALFAAADSEWKKLGTDDFLEAFAAHPRIGEKKAPPKNDAVGEHFSKWSAQEQAGAAAAAQTTLEKLKAQNDAYFDKHGFIFIVCATGKSADEMLGLLEARLPNERATEIQNAAGEQSKITVIRLTKWLTENSQMITTHILDTTLGKPARAVPIQLERQINGAWTQVGAGQTDDDGRLKTLTPAGPVEPGVWRIRFDTKHYFASTGTKGFYPFVEVVFEIVDGAAHYHVPLLINPWGYSTYRGS